jgi:aryl-alcohol dehydrogenase-like predicted oxidoreductase
MTFGDTTNEADAKKIFDEAIDAGVNFIDTADTYAEERSQQIVGRLISSDRHRFVLATKIANGAGSGPNQRGLSRKWIMERVSFCLQQLATDFIDILYLHKEDIETPLLETVRAVADLQRAGKIRYFAVSNFKAWRVAQICAICDSEGIDRPVASQPLYHALNRTAEIEQLPMCNANGLGVVSYSPTARGVLSGKYQIDIPPPAGSRAAVGNPRILQTEYQPANIRVANAIASHARERGIDPVAFAVAWVLANPFLTSVIAGPRTIDQWRTYRSAVDVTITDDDERLIDGLVRPGTAAVHQFSDPAYPVEGRPRRSALANS